MVWEQGQNLPGYSFSIQAIPGTKNSLSPLLDKLVRDTDTLYLYITHA